MSNRTPKKTPENLIEFAKLASISEASLGKILEKLQQAGIDIKDPREKLSSQTKAQLLAFFRRTPTHSSVTQTRVSKLKSGAGSAKNVVITTVIRKSAQDVNEQEEEHTQDHESAVESTPIGEKTSLDTPAIETAESLELSESSAKKSKTAILKKKTKLEPPLKSAKRGKNKTSDLSVEGPLDEEETIIETASSTVTSRSSEQYIYKTSGSFTQTFEKPIKPTARDIWIPERLTVLELARKMSIRDADIMKRLERIGVSVEHYDDWVDQDTAVLLAQEMGHNPRLLLNNAEEIKLRESLDTQMSEVTKRPPIITIMGHVDHGKTSILDYIRRTKVATGEAGGITQHISAFHVKTQKGVVTFLDTPGHAAFTAMRARGARLTDIVALVVAADDGMMPQTEEAIQHAQAANVPIVVVINKMDKPGATVDLAQQGLAKYNLIPEEWGGETLFIPVSAKTGDGINDLLDALLLQAEMSELKAPVKGPGQGIVVESRLDKGQGAVVTMIVQKGTLKKGDILLAGNSFGRVRALHDENGKSISSATPSIPVAILGLSHPPLAGEEVMVVPSERTAREIIQARKTAEQESALRAQSHSLEALMDPFKTQLSKSINVILKADVQGSAEALKESLLKLSTEEVTFKLLMIGIGTITESDVNLAIASKSIIFGFNVGADSAAKRLIQKEKIVVHYHSIIYEMLDEAKKMVIGLLEPIIQETVLGKATVREIFRTTKTGTVAGCIVTEGSIHSNQNVRVLRKKKMIYEGKLHSLRRFKDDVKEVNIGTECGISIKNYTDLQVADVIESYERIQIARKE